MKSTFKPTYLYIKQHTQTGMKYFGKTSRTEKFLIEQYNGSGKHWTNHIKKHGTTIQTTWYELFDDEKDCMEFAIFFSEEMNIVKSKQWANEKPENGINGGSNGRPGWNPGNQTRELWKQQRTGKIASNATKQLMSDKQIGEKNPNALAWEITDPTGKIYKGKGLRAMCRNNGWKFEQVYFSRNGWKAIKHGTGKGGALKNAQ